MASIFICGYHSQIFALCNVHVVPLSSGAVMRVKFMTPRACNKILTEELIDLLSCICLCSKWHNNFETPTNYRKLIYSYI